MAIDVTEFREHESGTLRGFLTIRMSQIGLEIRGVGLHEKGGSRWFSMPSKPFRKKDGSQGFSNMIEFYDKSREAQFRKAALDALDRYEAGSGSKDGPF